jgi:hypothetical protein
MQVMIRLQRRYRSKRKHGFKDGSAPLAIYLYDKGRPCRILPALLLWVKYTALRRLASVKSRGEKLPNVHCSIKGQVIRIYIKNALVRKANASPCPA